MAAILPEADKAAPLVPTDERFKPYRKFAVAWLRPHEVGEPLNSVSVSDADASKIYEPGGFIAINPANEGDKWYVAKDFFDANYEPAGPQGEQPDPED